MFPYARIFWKILFQFREYKPKAVNLLSVWEWLSQFPKPWRRHLFLLLDKIDFISEKEAIRNLIELNNNIIKRLEVEGVRFDRIIYIASDTAASSSHIMLGLLRDNENLERKGAKLISSRDAHFIQEITSQIGTGAIIYVDDFAGTGKQFTRNRKWSAQFIFGAFSEFFLAPVICEEAFHRIEDVGVVPITNNIYKINQRPLHSDCRMLSDSDRSGIVELCMKINPKEGLGFNKLATMIVFYRNAPNTTPLIFRGSLKQSPYKGIFPRTDDLTY
jgi:hypothetical protein